MENNIKLIPKREPDFIKIHVKLSNMKHQSRLKVLQKLYIIITIIIIIITIVIYYYYYYILLCC